MTALTALLILIVVMVIGVPIPLSFLASAAYICFVNGTDHLMLFTYGFRVQNTMMWWWNGCISRSRSHQPL